MGTEEPDWLRLQKKIFSRYVEQRLKDGGITRKINSLVEEMKSGELLLQLLEVMSGVASGKKTKDTKLRIQQIQNVNDAIDFAKKVGVDFTKIRISAEDFVDGKEQSVLAAVFQIIIRFLKFDDEEESKTGGGGIDVREALMLWLKNKTAGYAGITIKDFTKSFHDGLPFLALIHKLRPRLVDYDTCVSRGAKINVQEALSLGEKYLSIPQYIGPDDLKSLNEISMLVYLTDWYAGVVLLQKQDIAAARIGKLEDITELHDKLRANYLERATALKAWVTSTIAAQADRTIDDTMAGIRARVEEFHTYKKVAKTEQIGLKLDALALYDNLAARLVNNNRPTFTPAGLLPADLETLFTELEKSEVARSQYLNAELTRQIQLATLYKRFQGNGSKLSVYATDKDAQIKALPTGNSQDALDSLDSLDVIQVEVTQTVNGPLVELNRVGDNLVAERFEFKADVTAIQTSINAILKAVQELIVSLRNELYEKLYGWYTGIASGLVSFATSTIAAQADRTIDDTMAGAKARLEEFETYKKDTKPHQVVLLEEAKSLYENITSRVAIHQREPFAPVGLVPSDLINHFQQLDQSETARSVYLNAELTRQLQLAKLYRRFQSNAPKLLQFTIDKDAQIKALPSSNTQEALDSLDSLDVIEIEVKQTVSGPLVELNRVGDNLVAERFEFKADVTAAQTQINANSKSVQELIVALRNELYEKLFAWYTATANGLVSFVTSTIAAQADRTIDDTMAGIRARLAEFEAYKKDTKPPQVDTLETAKNLHKNISIRLANHQREPFTPAGLVPADLTNHSHQLDQSEAARAAYLGAELTRQLKLAELYRRFQSNAPKLLQFTIDKDVQIKALPYSNFQEALSSLDSLDVIETEVKQTVSGPLVELNRVGDFLVAERFEFKADVTASQTQINANFKAVQELIVALRNEWYTKLFAWYTDIATGLVSFVTTTIAAQADRTIDDTMSGIRARLEEFDSYKKNTKPPQLDSLETAKNLHKNISIRLVNHQREPFTPAGLVPDNLTHHFQQLDHSETARAAYLSAELTRQLQLAELYRQFQSNAPKLLQFTNDKDAQTKALPSSNTEEALDSLDSLDVIEIEVKQSVSGPLVELNRVGDFLVAERFEFKADVTAQQTQINANFKSIQELIVALRNEWYEKLFAWYTGIATGLVSFVTSTIAAQADRTIDDTMSGIRARLAEFEAYKKNIKPPQVDLLDTGKQLHKNISIRLASHQREPFTPAGLVPADLTNHFQQLDQSETARAAYLSAELTRQIQLAELYRQFQGNAPKLLQFAADKDAQIKALPSANSEDALDSLDSLDVIEIEVKQSVSGPLVELNRVGDNLVAERFEFKADVIATQTQTNANYKAVQELIVALRNELYEKLFAWYSGIATGLVSFVTSTIAAQADRTIDNTMSGVKGRLEQFETYKKTDKREQANIFADAKSLYENISSRLVNHQRDAYTPAGLVPSDLAHHFHQLDQSEVARAAYLHAELARQIQLAKAYRQFQGNTAKLNQWLKEKEPTLKAPLAINSVDDAVSEIDTIDILTSELNNVVSGALIDFQKLSQRLVSESFEESKSVSETEVELTTTFTNVQNELKAKNVDAQAQLQVQRDTNERLYQAFASAVTTLQTFVQAKRDALHAEEKAEADKQLTVVEGLVADSEAATAGLVGAVESADKDVQARELVNNPHTNVSASDALSTLTFFTVLIQKKVALLKEHVEEKKRGGLSPEQIAEIHANFAYFDKDSNGFLNKKELRTCLQSLGEESTPQSINVILDKYDSGKKGTLTKAEFEVFIRESLGDTGTAEEIIKSFRYLTYDAPFFTEQNLLNVVNNRTFTEHHVDYLKQEVKQTEPGHYDYATWTAEAFAR